MLTSLEYVEHNQRWGFWMNEQDFKALTTYAEQVDAVRKLWR